MCFLTGSDHPALRLATVSKTAAGGACSLHLDPAVWAEFLVIVHSNPHVTILVLVLPFVLHMTGAHAHTVCVEVIFKEPSIDDLDWHHEDDLAL